MRRASKLLGGLGADRKSDRKLDRKYKRAPNLLDDSGRSRFPLDGAHRSIQRFLLFFSYSFSSHGAPPASRDGAPFFSMAALYDVVAAV